MLNFASQEPDNWRETNNYYEFSPTIAKGGSQLKIDSAVKLFADKLCVPAPSARIERPRLFAQLEKSLTQFSATLIAGRAGTGKTALAADYARRGDYNVAWYKVETADSDWQVFYSYLSASLNRFCPAAPPSPNIIIETADSQEVAAMSESLAAQISVAAEAKPLLIILDDLHSVFDAVWFADFFNSFVPSLAPNVHLLLAARTLPPLQLWRLRSKQVLGVLDEKLLAFTLEETISLFGKRKLSPSVARAAHKLAYGKIARLEEIIEKKSPKSNVFFV
jgi:LuxR family maltose regulon positive regulatory protein